jgi:hypothetical protein
VVALAALPVISIFHVPLAPVPVGDGTSVPMTVPIADLAAAEFAAINTASPTVVDPKFVLAVAAVDAFVPPLEIGTGAFN